MQKRLPSNVHIYIFEKKSFLVELNNRTHVLCSGSNKSARSGQDGQGELKVEEGGKGKNIKRNTLIKKPDFDMRARLENGGS